MKIVSRRKIEDCFDGSAVFSYEMSEPWSAENARLLASLGGFEYFADFPRPLFRLRTCDGLFVSGVDGSLTCRVILPRTNRNEVQKKLEEVFIGDK